MVAVFSTPILTIAADAVRDLEGRDAVSSLWSVFTKCQGSLENGPRLENITWRLWHRELKLEQPSSSQSSALQCVAPSHQNPIYSPVPSPSPATAQHGTRSLSRVGQVICELIPVPTLDKRVFGQLPPSDVRSANVSESTTTVADLDSSATAITASPPITAPPAITALDSVPQPFASQNTTSCPPTPEMEADFTGHSVVRSSSSPSTTSLISVVTTAPRSPFSAEAIVVESPTSSVLSAGVIVQPSVDLLSLPTSSLPPKLVVVDPTPNPTPHPTPPTTPHIGAGVRQQWLAPPIRGNSRVPGSTSACRNEIAVGAGKAKSKVAMRTFGKHRPTRRHSAGPDLDFGKGNETVVHPDPPPNAVEHNLFLSPPPMPLIKEEEKPSQVATTAVAPPTSRRSSASSRTNTTDSARVSPRWMSEKAKGKLKAVDQRPPQSPPPPAAASSSKKGSKCKSRSTADFGDLDPALAAKVRDSLADPLLPQGRPVVVDSESGDESDPEDGWSSEEMTDQTQELLKQELATQEKEKEQERERERQEAERMQHEMLLRKVYMQQQQQQPQPRPAGLQRTQSSHYPHPNHARTGKVPAAHRPRHQQQLREFALHHAKLEQAAREAQRQRDMIKKLPTESFQNLAKARANSVGLLTQLLNPNPEIFPPNHPYRRGSSSGAIHPLGVPPIVAIQSTTSEPGPNPSAAAGSDVREAGPQPSRPSPSADKTRTRISSRPPSQSVASPSIRGVPLQPTKSLAALPISSQVLVGSLATKGQPSVAVTTQVLANKQGRPRGPPKDQDLEDDSETDLETGNSQISSIAEQKLKALVERRGVKQSLSNPSQPQAGPSKQPARVDEEVPAWARVSQLRSSHGLQFTPMSRPPPHVPTTSSPPPTAPIPLGHPYNLPPADPPTTPRTTRRQMLATELSESLRRNLLWERQLTKNNLAGMKRSSSTIVGRTGEQQPPSGMSRVVQLHAKGTIPVDQQDDPSKRVLGVLVGDDEQDQMRNYAMTRNRSWANDFHYTGW